MDAAEKEVISIMFKDHKSQLIELEKIANIKIDFGEGCVKKFLEFCERRNLFTHNDGVVNRRYLRNCDNYGLDISEVDLGQKLQVTQEYFDASVKATYELVTRIAQSIWRKMERTETERADTSLNNVAYRLIERSEYKLARKILRYAANEITHSDEFHRCMLIINHANAAKLDGDEAGASEILSTVDWSATGLNFQICVAAIRDDYGTVLRLLEPALKAEAISKANLREWPVFKSIRTNEGFRSAFSKMFDEELMVADGTSELGEGMKVGLPVAAVKFKKNKGAVSGESSNEEVPAKPA